MLDADLQQSMGKLLAAVFGEPPHEGETPYTHTIVPGSTREWKRSRRQRLGAWLAEKLIDVLDSWSGRLEGYCDRLPRGYDPLPYITMWEQDEYGKEPDADLR